MELTPYKQKTIERLQEFHIQQFHLRVVADDICPLSCPVRGCAWGSTRHDSEALRVHIYKVGSTTWSG